MRIIIFTDSLGRPRPDISDHEKTKYKDVYGFLLKDFYKGIHEIELIYVESLDTADALYWNQRMVSFREPDLVIYHLGINDCSPRLFKKNNKNILFNSFFRKISFDFFLKTMSYFRYWITKFRKITYVNEINFKKNLLLMNEETRKYNSRVKFISIGIAKSIKLDQKSFGYNFNVTRYNEILHQVFKDYYLDINPIIEKFDLISDGVHLSKLSHIEIFKKLREIIDRF